ncbi:oxygen-independent coproporphyrinogen III oxidase [Psychroflexus montanilacus]|uniref:oxygen-independent coproporphyrinogen III oxidase n=1 Tax=Psychroflexus montanilacus TaxID=2873598 RepID=UPI001CCF9CD5|nr:oxygen-independent coproporphyrinogen III oxidase [Psychroflexus montanilacus]MBZ9651753.1 oxygen-independent coproporphyrinogen III oxidase [Psychroflexus montanilacus]
MQELIQKYNVPGPRYTSYPTVPFWDEETYSASSWIKSLQKSNSSREISLYIHLPFCESLCTFCACNKRITKRHEVELPYIKALLKEWEMYLEILEGKPVLKEIHLGGGTPTFFDPKHLEYLLKTIKNSCDVPKDVSFSFEGHPNNTTINHLETLRNLGFDRVSYGIQDYNPKVQIAIHRIQSFETVKKITKESRALGYKSVSHDLIYGLPLQSLRDVIATIEKTIELMPDRIAFYSYAHVPWTKGNGQRGYDEKDLPSAELKRQQYEIGKQMLEDKGYVEIGMDHFALPNDELALAFEHQNLHRNFMGYTTTKTNKMIGLGVSAISDSWFGFSQNHKDLNTYYSSLNNDILPVSRGHILNETDLIIRRKILNLMCHFETDLEDLEIDLQFEIKNDLVEFESDQLLKIMDNTIKVNPAGKAFIRNVCMAFDLRLKAQQTTSQLFSMTI